MAVENNQPQEMDLDRTDKLPILEGVLFDDDVADDAVRLERTLPGAPLLSGSSSGEFVRPSSIDLPSLAESVRSVEERIARQNAEFEALTRTYERVRDAETAALARAGSMERDLAAARAALEAERVRSRDFEKSSIGTGVALEAARSRAEEAARDSERHQSEAKTLRESLAARDATIVQVLHALSERDTQLSALQSEHARVVPALEARTKSSTQLEDELSAVRAQLNTGSMELKRSQQQANALGEQAKRSETEIRAARAGFGGSQDACELLPGIAAHPRLAQQFSAESISRHGRESRRSGCSARDSESRARRDRSSPGRCRSHDRRAQRHDRASAKCRRGAGRLGC